MTHENEQIYHPDVLYGTLPYQTRRMECNIDYGRFVYAGAHQDILIYRAAQSSVETVETNGTWIGLLDDITDLVHDNTLFLHPGDVMLLFYGWNCRGGKNRRQQ